LSPKNAAEQEFNEGKNCEVGSFGHTGRGGRQNMANLGKVEKRGRVKLRGRRFSTRQGIGGTSNRKRGTLG